MTIYYLYIKTHKKTGLKYLGQTKQDPFKYGGSGEDWTTHLRQYGNKVHTEIVIQTSNWDELTANGRYWSNYYRVVTAVDDFGNKIWANKIPETGGGTGDRLKGIPRSESTRKKIKLSMPDQSGNKNSFYGKKHSDETKKKCGLGNLGKDNKTLEGKKSLSKSLTTRWNDSEQRETQIQYLKNRKGEKRSEEAIESYKKAAKIRNSKITPEQRSEISKKSSETRKKNQEGYRRQRYVDEFGKTRFKLVPILPI
jgi:hypothetical protein